VPEGLDIAFFGSSLVSSWWNGACTYYRGIVQGLHRLGHRVTFYEPDAFGRQEHRDIDDPPYARVVVYPASDRAARALMDEAAGADVVVKASGVGAGDTALEQGLAELAAPGRPPVTVFWDVDAPATLAQLGQGGVPALREVLPALDLVLTYGGGPPVVSAYRALGARRCYVIYNGLDPEAHHPVAPEPRFRADCGLLANRLPDREQRVDEFFFRAAALLPGHRFLLGGNGWEGKAMPANVRWAGHVGTAEHNAFNSSVRVVLNVTRDSMAATGWSPATRVFEAAGAGACLVSDDWEGIGDFFTPGREILVAGDGLEVADHLGTIPPGAARRLGEAARRRALAEHTYSRRASQVDGVLRDVLAHREARRSPARQA
jgi:spore maturation protein CgeB